MKNKTKELTLGFLMLIFSILYFYFSFEINTRDDVINSKTLPYILSALVFLLSIGQLINAVRINDISESKEVKDYGTVIKASLAIILYIYFFEDVGFIVMTSLFLISMFVFLTPEIYKPRYSIYLAVSILASFSIYMLFRYGLDVLLPQGIITVI